MATQYHVYSSDAAGDPIDYEAPVATAIGTTWVSPSLGPGSWSFGVRAFDPASGLEEQNLDCAVTLVLDANGNDVTDTPRPPVGLRAFATANAGIRVEWFYPPTGGPTAPAGFHVYVGTGGTPDYSSPAATVSFRAGIASTFVANLAGLTGATTYWIGVRAYNGSGEETNAIVASVTADATGPAAVGSLTAAAIV